MNSTNPRDTYRDVLAREWYDSLPPKEKRRVDNGTSWVYLMLHENPQSVFSHRMALEVAFMAAMYLTYGPMDERLQ